MPFIFGQHIAQGGMGAIIQADDCKLGRQIAVKVMLSKAGMSAEMRKRFVQEAAVLGKLEHPNIVPVHDLGRDSEGQLYYSMKLVVGRTLQDIIDDLRRQDPVALDHFTLDRLLTILRKVCDAMAFAHSEGIIHRDLKPENIMVGEFGEVLVMDWGISKLLGDAGGTAASAPTPGSAEAELASTTIDKTLEGSVMGTPQFMSPEQAAGEVGEIDARSDIYSLGGILYAILTLRPPVEGENVFEVLEKVQAGELTSPAVFGTTSKGGRPRAKEDALEAKKLAPLPHIAGGRVPSALSAVVMKALALKKEDRYQDVTTFSEEIERWQGGFATTAEEAGLGKQIALLIKRHKTLFTTAFAAWVIITALAVWFVINLQAKEQRAVAGEVEALRNQKIAENNAYSSDMLILKQAWTSGNMLQFQEVLNRYRDRDDLRGLEWDYWNRLAQKDAPLIINPMSQIDLANPGATGASFSPNGERILWSNENSRNARIFSTEDGTEIRSLIGHTQGITGAAFNHDGTRVATASHDGTAKVWDTSTWQPILTLQGHEGPLTAVSFAPTERLLATASKDRTVRFWDLETGEEARQLGSEHVSSFVAFRPDGEILGSRGRKFDGVRLTRVSTGEELIELGRHFAQVIGISFSANRNRLVTAGSSGTVRFWLTGNWQELRESVRINETPHDIAPLSPDATLYATANSNNTATVFSVDSGRKLRTFRGHSRRLASIAFSPDGTKLVSGSTDGSARIWDFTTEEGMLELGPGTATFSPDGKVVAIGRRAGALGLWDATTGQETLALEGHENAVQAVSFSPDGTRMASVSSSFDRGGRLLSSPNRERMESAIKLWDLSTGKELLDLEADGAGYFGVSFCPAGTRLAAAGRDETGGTVRMWDANTGQQVLSIRSHARAAWDLTFNHDGTQLASSGADQTVRLWDTATGDQILTLEGHSLPVRAVSFSPDGKHLASAGEDGTMRVWDLNSGEELLTCTGHATRVSEVTYSPNGRRLATASFDNTVKIWNATTGKEMFTLDEQPWLITNVSFSPAGQRLAISSGSATTPVKIWDARPWTPQLRTESNARGLLNYYLKRAKTLKELQSRIREHPTSNEEVRHQALDWTGLFWENRN